MSEGQPAGAPPDTAAPDGIIAWFARNPVAANLLMIIIMVVGLGSAFTIQRAMFPAFDLEVIFINMSYPGAPPEEVEQGIVLKIEEAMAAVARRRDANVKLARQSTDLPTAGCRTKSLPTSSSV